jgi:hypothetical protein|tara:strand:- start:42 stop:935 length:894 start_codon:yes stop_codon:yes gene_type:complete
MKDMNNILKRKEEKTMRPKKPNGGMSTILGKKIDFKDYKASQGVVKVLCEKNHSKFTLLDDNRDIQVRHVEALMASIRKFGQLMPIVVNEKMEVIEGQHRLRACSELNIAVAYIVSTKASGKDIAVMNNSQKGWKNRDYLKHFSHYNHYNSSEYKKVQKFFDDYSLPFHTGLMILSGVKYKNRGNDRGPMPSFRAGTFKVNNLEVADTLGGQLMKLKSFVPRLVRVNKFCLAFIRVSKLENFSLQLAYSQIEKNFKKFERCGNQEEWDEAMVKAYNHQLQAKGKKKQKRISIRKEGF